MALIISQFYRRSGIAKQPSRLYSLCSIALLSALTIATTQSLADTQQLVKEGIAEYKAGHLDKAVPLLVQALKEDRQQRSGALLFRSSVEANGARRPGSQRTDMAAKFCPPAVLQSLAAQAIADHTNGKSVQQKPQPAPVGLPSFASLSSGFMGMFNNKNSDSAVKTSSSGSAPAPSPCADPFVSMRKSFKSAGNWFRKAEPPSADQVRRWLRRFRWGRWYRWSIRAVILNGAVIQVE